MDSAATTPVDPRVAALVVHLMTQEYGNAGSRTHGYGVDALREVNKARERIATSLASTPDEVIFTSGATEADNLAILGLAAHGSATARRHIVSTAIEHKAVLEPLDHLRSHGFEVTLVRPDAFGRVSVDEVAAALRPDTLLVSMMHGNNETGALQPVEDVAARLEDKDIFLHVDAAQTFGRETQALKDRRIDLISISGHKIFGPKGIGALIVRRRNGCRAPIAPLMFGGGQERGLRPGTLPTPLIAGFGLAAELAENEGEDRRDRCLAIRSEALAALTPLNPIVHGDAGPVLPHILSFALPGIDSEAIMVSAKDLVAISNGSACTSSHYAPSHVLAAMGLDEDVLLGTIRISWSHMSPPVAWSLFAKRLEDLRF
jgi:cysteine desulfurase